MVANATGFQVANAPEAFATLFGMDEEELQAYRLARLELAVTRYGGPNGLGKALTHKDGGFIRQMLNKKRRINEKFVMQLEALEGMEGWFALPPVSGEPLVLTEEEMRWVLAARAAKAQTKPNPFVLPDDGKPALRKPKETKAPKQPKRKPAKGK